VKYKAYPSYKDSGVEWLGDIPESWGVKTLKYVIMKTIDNRGRTPAIQGSGIPMLEAKHINATSTYNSKNFDKFISNANHKIFIRDDIKENDILFVTVGTIGKTNLVGSNPSFVIAQNIIAFRLNEGVNPSFFLNYLRSSEIKEAMNATNKNSILDSIKLSDFVQARISLAPLQEQKSIANYLDKATAKIDTLIEKQTKLIELLKEKRQAVISSAVTRGLDASVPMKDSGVEWLGDIPEHWVGRKLKYLARIKGGKDQKQVIDDSGMYPVYGSGGIFGNATEFLYSGESVLLGRKGTVDKPLYVNGKFWTVDTMYFTEIEKPVFPKWFFYSCLTIHFDYYQYGSAVPSMTQEDLHNIKFSTPSLMEQKEIAYFLDKTTAKIDNLITKSTQAIDLLKEKRTALISAAVTGKIDVRDAA